ncbi:MAG: addiction module protein [Deltaproteobacteria bacterium]|nr:addiction module protein [Deltaproteobacteria bacterium]
MRDAHQVLEESLALPAADRARLAKELLASLDEPADEDAAERWVSEIEARSAEVDCGTGALEPWEDLRRRLLARLTPR